MRKAEMERLRALLGAEYASEDDYLKTLWDTMGDLASVREAHLVWVSMGGMSWAYGPFYDLGQAKRAGKLWACLDGVTVQVRPMRAPAGVAPAEPDWVTLSRHCGPCAHPKFSHDWPVAAYPPGKTFGCIVKGCDCTERF